MHATAACAVSSRSRACRIDSRLKLRCTPACCSLATASSARAMSARTPACWTRSAGSVTAHANDASATLPVARNHAANAAA
ncbi:hypothetical protein [Streptomyces sp. NPDC051079]|uniref:hypothetical protein n=1 Tax=Streptomyces sp. NPDC051079 TaxID=3155043 RepID=UPI00344BA7B3